MKVFSLIIVLFEFYFLVSAGEIALYFLPIVLLLVLSCYFSYRIFSFFDLQNIFCFIFFVAIPQMEIMNGISYWGLNPLNTEEILHANLSIFIYHLVAFVFQFGAGKKSKKDELIFRLNVRNAIIVTLVSIIVVWFYYKVSLISLFFRGFEFGYLSKGLEMTNLEWLVIEHFIRVIPFVTLLHYIRETKYTGTVNKGNKLALLFLLISTVVLTFPSGIARFLVGIIYGAIFFVSNPKYLTSRNIAFFIVFGLLIVFPFLDNFRHFNGNISFFYSRDYFASGHFDAYFNLAETSNVSLTYGWQAIGVLLFFIPRSLWASKPLNSGTYVANELSMSWENISMPYIAEGYLNFGYIGVVLFACISSYLFLILDEQVARKLSIGYLFVGIVVFLLRGSLMSAFAYGIGIYFAFKLAGKLILAKS